MDDSHDMKEKAQRLSENYNEIFKYVANADKKNSDAFQKGVIPKNQLVSTDNVQEDSEDVDMTDVSEVKELKLSQIMDPSSPNDNEDNSENDYVANWEEDVSDPLEMLMISKDSEQLSSHVVRPKSENVQRGQYNPGRRGFQRGKRSSHQNSNRSRSNYSRPRNSHHNSYSGRGSFWGDNYDFSANSSEVFYYQRRSKYNGGRQTGPWEDFDEQSVGPSDSASQINERSFVSQNSHDSGVSSTDLAQTLSELENFSASLLTMIDKYDFDHREVKRTVENNSNTFELKDEIVSLKPKFQICESHIQSTGCINGNECSELHICPQFITDSCDSKNCLMGHFWKTNHNLEILKTHSVAALQIPTLNKLFLSSLSKTQNVHKNLQICLDYNSGKCQKDNCNDIHLCLAFLAKLCTPQDKCQLHHNPLHKEVSPILVRHGISTNESPRDVVLSIMESPLIKQETNKFNASGDSSIPFNVSHNNTSSSTEKTIKYDKPSTSKDVDISQRGDMKGADTVRKAKATTWSHNFLGEVKIPEICYYSVENYCKFEETGCLKLHCFQHFHWQVCETGKPWVNLRDFQALDIEKAFCDPQIDKVDVKPLDPSKLDPLIKPLLVTMQGKSLWKADFKKMQLVLSKLDNNQQPSKQSGNAPTALKLRRLCTEYIPNQVPKACIFSWYFLDKNKKWVEYGLVDSTGDTDLKCDVTSADIEKHHRERPNSPLPFMSSRFTYVIDTAHRVQLNLDTNVSRRVRRRPIHHLKKETFSLRKFIGVSTT